MEDQQLCPEEMNICLYRQTGYYIDLNKSRYTWWVKESPEDVNKKGSHNKHHKYSQNRRRQVEMFFEIVVVVFIMKAEKDNSCQKNNVNYVKYWHYCKYEVLG